MIKKKKNYFCFNYFEVNDFVKFYCNRQMEQHCLGEILKGLTEHYTFKPFFVVVLCIMLTQIPDCQDSFEEMQVQIFNV